MMTTGAPNAVILPPAVPLLGILMMRTPHSGYVSTYAPKHTVILPMTGAPTVICTSSGSTVPPDDDDISVHPYLVYSESDDGSSHGDTSGSTGPPDDDEISSHPSLAYADYD